MCLALRVISIRWLFRNPDGTIVVVAQNALEEERPFEFADPCNADRGIKVTLAPRSFNTFVLD